MKRILFKDEIISFINIGLFGSHAKDQQTVESDIDFLVEFVEPRFDWMASRHGYMES